MEECYDTFRHHIDDKDSNQVITTYTIQMASKISGVGVHTIRAWEKRYKALEPNRDHSGHRIYTKSDVEKLILLSELCLLGYAISKVANLPVYELKSLLKDLGKSSDSIESLNFNLVQETVTIDHSQAIGILFFALKNRKFDVISQELDKLKQSLSARDFALEVLLPLTVALKKEMTNKVVSEVDEEVLFSIIKHHSAQYFHKNSIRREKSNSTVLVANIDKVRQKDLSSLISALLCFHYGFNMIFIDQNMSVAALANSTQVFSSDAIILTATNIVEEFGPAVVVNYFEELAQKIPRTTQVVLLSSSAIPATKIAFTKFNSISSLESLDKHLASLSFAN